MLLNFGGKIKKENPYDCELEKAIVVEGKDITHLVLDLEKEKLMRTMNEDNLPLNTLFGISSVESPLFLSNL